MTLGSVDPWHVAQEYLPSALMCNAVRLVVAWHPVPVHEGVTTVSWIGAWSMAPWHAEFVQSFVDGTPLEWQIAQLVRLTPPAVVVLAEECSASRLPEWQPLAKHASLALPCVWSAVSVPCIGAVEPEVWHPPWTQVAGLKVVIVARSVGWQAAQLAAAELEDGLACSVSMLAS